MPEINALGVIFNFDINVPLPPGVSLPHSKTNEKKSSFSDALLKGPVIFLLGIFEDTTLTD